MATINTTTTLKQIIAYTTASPPQITWHRFVAGSGASTLITNDTKSAQPAQNTAGWNSFVVLDHQNIVAGTFTGKVLVAGQHVQTITDWQPGLNLPVDAGMGPGSSGNPDAGGNLVITNVVTNPLFQLTAAKIYRTSGFVQLNWNSYRDGHSVISDYEYLKTSIDTGDLSVLYYTGDTPWAANSTYPWGLAVSFAPRAAGSIIKVTKLILYQSRQPTFVLEPQDGTEDAQQLSNLFQNIENQVLGPFYNFLTATPVPATVLG